MFSFKKSLTAKKILSLVFLCALFVLPLIVNAGVKLTDPLGINEGEGAIPKLANRFISTALGLSGVLALVAFIYGGILYMLAGVNPKNVEKGKELMKYAVIGLFVIFSAYAVINYLLTAVLLIK